MTDHRESNGNGAVTVIRGAIAAWPVLVGLIAFFVGYIELRTSSQISRAIKDDAVTRIEWDVRRQATDQAISDMKAKATDVATQAAAADALLEQRLAKLEAQIETIQERQRRLMDKVHMEP